MNRIAPFLLFCLMVFALPARAGIEVAGDPVPDFASMLKDADTLTIYEGLPHPLFEKFVFEREKHTKKVFFVTGDYFYEKPLTVSVEDRQTLIHAFRSVALVLPYRGMKLCGGFHADYMIEWKRGSELIAQVLLCFGCGEAKLVTTTKPQYFDMSRAGNEVLFPVLRKYRQERPLPTKDAPVPSKTPGADAAPRPLVDPKIPPPKIEIEPPKPEIQR